MTRKKDLFSNLGFFTVLIIAILVLSSIIFIFTPEIQLKLHTLQLKRRTYKILCLVNDLHENHIETAKSTRVYCTLCTMGFSETINSTFNDLVIPFESKWLETDKVEDLNMNYLDRFDLIVIGGIGYWWQYASNHDKAALTSTETPILSSAQMGIYPDLNDLTGVYTEKEPNEAWGTSVLPFEETSIQYHMDSLNGYLLKRKIWLVDVSPTPNATIIASAFRKNKTYPYLIYDGVKNYYINTYTYTETAIAFDISIILDEIFNLYPDSYYFYIKSSPLRRIINTLLIPIVIAISNMLCQKSITIKDRKLKLNMDKTVIAISISTFLLITPLLLSFLVTSYFPQILIEHYFSITLLVGSIILFLVLSLTIARARKPK